MPWGPRFGFSSQSHDGLTASTVLAVLRNFIDESRHVQLSPLLKTVFTVLNVGNQLHFRPSAGNVSYVSTLPYGKWALLDSNQ